MEQVKEVIATISEYIQVLTQDIDETIEMIDQGRDGEAFSYTSEIAKALQELAEALQVKPIAECYKIDIQPITEVFKELVRSFENKDMLLVKDILQYEIKVLLKEWENKLSV